MKTYEPATLVELGNASDLVLGGAGIQEDNIEFLFQDPATLMDIDE